MALGGIDLQFSLPLPQPMENPKRRSRVAMPWLQPSASTPSMEKCSSLLDNFLTTAEERMFLRNMMPMTPSMQRCSNLLDNLLTTAEERTLLRNMMPRTAFPSETSNMQPEVERSLEDPKCTPLLVASSQVEYNPFMIGVPNAPEDEFLVF
ncbi:uncharacterized protein N7498_005982 [Penicillium cinerascens]|uniref:Uncharacterized protein n=1 Tax=Penicillium cinerascens TaxID=70096 RepID=A0A9W9MPJ4_9EURO|nr:uncharacterized protein N7498_005982 [Penicillium cinerascens]KAJ5205103.1 hypothetical protein N7498_005982 [Penicillium cinerascens]